MDILSQLRSAVCGAVAKPGLVAGVLLSVSGCAGPLTSSDRGLSSHQSKATIKKAADDPFPTAAAAGVKNEAESKDSKKS